MLGGRQYNTKLALYCEVVFDGLKLVTGSMVWSGINVPLALWDRLHAGRGFMQGVLGTAPDAMDKKQ